jgi:hypothetical protein
MRRTALLGSLLALVAAVAPLGGSGSTATAASRWAPVGDATIHPGVQMYTEGAQCTANFVFTDAAGRVYVGYAAHCAGTGEATETDGCDAGSHPLGTRVRFASDGSLLTSGTTLGRGRLVYSSWLSMQRLGTKDADVCAYNDLALVRVGKAHIGKVNPTVPFWGGPVGLNKGGTAAGDEVYTFGSSSLRAGVTELSPKVGRSLGDDAGGWTHPVYTVSPGVPGDSGSGFLDAQGRALGTLSTLTLLPLTGSNGVGDLRHELSFAQQHAGIDGLRLVKGTQPFSSTL